jgi:transposase
MKIVSLRAGVNASGHLVLSVDVSKTHLDCYVRLTDRYRRILNTSPVVRAHLIELSRLARREDLAGVLVACEPSGGYERTLLETARSLGCRCVYVSGEQVAQLRKIESLDTGKTDVKDPRVIELAVRLGKTLRYRHLPPMYEELRLITGATNADEGARARTKQRIVTTTIGLFPGYDLGKDRFFSRTGRAVIDAYHLDPSAIVRGGRKRFERTMRRHVAGVHAATLDKIYAQAEAAGTRSSAARAVLKERIEYLMGDLDRYNTRMASHRSRIENLGRALQDDGLLCRLDEDVSGLTLYNLARIAGEAGPFTDFHSRRALLRYAGLNLRERQSGQYRGRTRLSKKGRIMLRKAAAQATFPLLRHDRLFGEMYGRKRAGGMCAQKAKVAVMRKFLIVVYAMTLSGRAFNAYRFTNAARSTSRAEHKQIAC